MLFSNVREDEFEYAKEFEKNHVVYKEVKLKNRGCRCSNCGTFHTNVKEYSTKKIVHSVYAHQKCVIIFKHRRFICPKCGTTHMENNPFCSEVARVSDQTIENVLLDLKRYNNNFSSTAERYFLTVRGVISIFDRYCQMERNTLPRVLCVDEVYFSRKRKKKYVLVMINFFNRAIIDVLKDRDKHTIGAYLSKISREERNRVEYVAIDMNEYYRDVFNIYLRNATIIVDSFHVIKRVGQSLDTIRKKVLRRFEGNRRSDEYYLLKYRDDLLYSDTVSYERDKNRHFKYYISENEMLERMLNIDTELEKAYELYHMYKDFNNSDYHTDLNEAENRLNEIIIEYKLSGIDTFYNLAMTLEEWRNEIVNSFSYVNGKRVSNGPIEGRNSLIKKIIKLANGFSNFKRFRNRIMYSLNKYANHNFKRE